MKPAQYSLPAPLVTISKEWLGGMPCFTGRRVPVQALFDYLKGGDTLDTFLEDYPSVSREHALAVLELGFCHVVASSTAQAAE